MDHSLKKWLQKEYVQLNTSHISTKNDFNKYDDFKNFVYEHYSLDHLKKYNYIKYVNIMRNILVIRNEEEYMTHINKINSILNILSSNSLFPQLDIRKYFFKLQNIDIIIDTKKKVLLETLDYIQNLFKIKRDKIDVQFKILMGINALFYKIKLYQKYTKQLKYAVKEFIILEQSYGIDHKLIEINNINKDLLGKQSEYSASQKMSEYVSYMNRIQNKKKYYYENNVNIFKLLSIKSCSLKPFKGEVDGMIISFDGNNYIIEYIIEVKSSIKSTFEDSIKLINFQHYIKNIVIDIDIYYEKYIFNKTSFKKICNSTIVNWCIYICYSQYAQYIEKSHFYFSSVLKILDNDFIKTFYIENNNISIISKYILIESNRDLVNKLFNEWKKESQLGQSKCNIFLGGYI